MQKQKLEVVSWLRGRVGCYEPRFLCLYSFIMNQHDAVGEPYLLKMLDELMFDMIFNI